MARRKTTPRQRKREDESAGEEYLESSADERGWSGPQKESEAAASATSFVIAGGVANAPSEAIEGSEDNA